MFDRAYVLELENLISDELLPMYLVGCRSSNKDPKMNSILTRLLEARTLRKETPALLKEIPSVSGKS